MMEIETIVEGLLAYAQAHLGLKDDDVVYTRNALLGELGLAAPSKEAFPAEKAKSMQIPDELTVPLREWLEKERGLSSGEAERKSDLIMGILSPLPSVVRATFRELYREDPKKATSYLYDLSIKNDYIKKSRVDKNVHFPVAFQKGTALEVSINLSKPEKSNKDIAAALKVKSTGYPECLLCPSNEGFYGNERHPSRENLRVIPLNLNNQRWYLQYSPYVYYNEHCIVFYDKHVPMEVGDYSIRALLSFVDQFPHYFIGSNSDLPIVGGSILNHEHFQGGGYDLPLLKAPMKRKLSGGVEGVDLYEVDFYDTAICLQSSDYEKIAKEALRIHLAWKKHDDPSCEIISHDEEGQHSTSTFIVKKDKGLYKVYMILRNNRKNEAYPDGIFHVHPEWSHIKKEGIGLIEAAGLFILPGRLERQLKVVEDAAANKVPFESVVKENPDLEGFDGMYRAVVSGIKPRAYLGGVCRYILDNVAVFKKDANGQKGLYRFLGSLSYGL